MSSRRVPLRHSLVTRLLATSVLIAVAAITATAWLATRTATRAISQEQGRSLTDDKGVYDMLLGYAATHRDWSGAAGLIRGRADRLGRRITLMTEDRVLIADSGPGPSLAAARPSATVDPLDLDLALTGGTNRIDARATGPYRLPAAERAELRVLATRAASCMEGHGVTARIGDSATGRPVLTVEGPPSPTAESDCRPALDEQPTRTEEKALAALGRMITACLGDGTPIAVSPTFQLYSPAGPAPGRVAELQPAVAAPAGPRVTSCLEKSRRAQLRPHVAPPALLFVTDPVTGADRTTFTLSPSNTVRIVAVTGAVLLAAVLITVLVGMRLIRPLRALTEAADQHVPVPMTGRDEIGRLARALHRSAERRDHAEAQRRAMVSDVAHELRTPLTNMRSWLEAAQDDLAPIDQQLVALLHEEATLLHHIIDDLSDLAAADAGTLRVHPATVAVRDVIAQVADIHRGAAQAAGVRLETVVEDEPTVRADPVRLRQIIGNLVSNAIRYTPAGGTVTVAAHDTVISVRDTGIGISAEQLPRIFDRFWRADGSRSRATGGSGLGLAITRKLVEAHRGTIEVESAPGRGALFSVRLPQ